MRPTNIKTTRMSPAAPTSGSIAVGSGILVRRSSSPEVPHVALPKRSPSPAHGGGAPGVNPPEPLAQCPRRARRARPSAPERARALLAITDGASYTAAAHQVGRRHNETISAWVSRFNRDGLAAVRPGHGGGPRIRYGAEAQQRILTEWARTPQREQDGTATWSLSLLQKALRHAPDGLPQVSTFTIWRTLHASGLSWQKSRTWCETGVAMRQRKHGVVRVSDPDALAKKTRSAKLTGTLAVPRRPGRHPGCGGSGCAGSGHAAGGQDAGGVRSIAPG